MTTRFIITSDLHQSIGKWPDLVRAVEQEKSRFVLIAGDLLPKEGGFNGQRRFFRLLADYLRAMRGSGETTILTFFGNDDFHPLEPLLDGLAGRGVCVNLNGKVHREAGFVFCGMNHVRDYLLAKPSLRDRLEALRSQLTPDEIGRSIWLVHNPPSDLGMDICFDGCQVGSPNILRFIQQTQPLLGCSGHIHESPYQSGGRWAARVGRTLWLQPGQEGQKLHYVSLEVMGGMEITSVTHSLCGLMPGRAGS